MRVDLKKRTIWFIVTIITALLGVQFVYSYKNSKTIIENIIKRREAESVKVNTLDIIRSLHEVDMGLRGYALVPTEQIAAPYKIAHDRIDSVLNKLDTALSNQDYQMIEFYEMRDSIQSYFKLTKHMFELLDQDRKDEFVEILARDYGYATWLLYQQFENNVNAFEDGLIDEANGNYLNALRKNYNAIIVLILLVVPTLLYTAYNTNKAYDVSVKLIQAQEEKNLLLQNQNETLEQLVKKRTEEIAAQNEEIQSNNEAISRRNEQLEEAKKVIEQKNQIIEARNKGLGIEVEKQTKHLRQSNKELIRNINQLEQFSYTVSHNLRAPVARLMGLTKIIEYARDHNEILDIQKKIFDASQELDKILKDLVLTIEIKKEVNNTLVEISLDHVIQKTLNLFQDEIKSNQVSVTILSNAKKIRSITAYVESILHNLISNSIKYRDSNRTSSIEISSAYQDEWVEIRVKDNGLGIDLDRNKSDLFNFYKRFHFHVEGRGLGLFLVKSQVELLGGTIKVDSEVDKGTTFIVRLRHNLNSEESVLM